MFYHSLALEGVGFEELGLDFGEILLSVVDLFVFGIVFEGGVGLLVAFGEFLHFAVGVDFVAFPEIAHGFNAGHELFAFMKVVCLCEDVDDFFGKISHNLQLLIFLLCQQIAISFPL